MGIDTFSFVDDERLEYGGERRYAELNLLRKEIGAK
jgi:hypothetical protein